LKTIDKRHIISEWDQKYTILKEALYRKNNPDKKPFYVILAFKDFDSDMRNADTKKWHTNFWKAMIFL
jgi:hypothetical protein